MTYSDLTVEEQILLAAEFVGRGQPIPVELRAALGPALIQDIEYPEIDNDQEC